MSKPKKLSFWKSVVLLFVGLVLVLITSAYLLLSYWEPIASKTIKDSFYQSTNKLYRIDFDDITFNIFLGNFSLKNIRLTPDMEVYKELKKKKEQPAYLFNLHIDRAKVHGIDLYGIYKERELSIDEIAINNPSVLVINDLSYKKSSSDTSIFRNPYDLIKSELNFLKVEQINLKNINLEFKTDSLGKSKSKKIFLSYFKVRNLFIDSLSSKDSTRPFYSDDIKLSIKNLKLPFRDSVNNMQLEEVVASTATNSIQVYNFRIIPKQDELNFRDTNDYRKTRIELYVKEANISDVDFKKLFFEQKLHGNTIDIKKLEANFFLNKFYPRNENKSVRFPTELVHDIRIPFYFKQVNLKNSKLNYGEIDVKTNLRWNIHFDALNGKISNFSNDSAVISKNNFTKIELSSLFNGTGKSNFEFILDYIHPLKPFYVKGSIMNYNLQGINPILSKLSKLEVTSCNLRQLRFVINGDKKQMNSNITMLYNNLKVKVLSYDEEKNKLKKSGILSLLANHMVLENENPRSDGKLVKSRFNLMRNKDQSFFGFIWKGLLRGIKESVGLDHEMEKELRVQANRYNDFKKFTKELKENREQRKTKRLLKRKERELKEKSNSKLNTSMLFDSTNAKTNMN